MQNVECLLKEVRKQLFSARERSPGMLWLISAPLPHREERVQQENQVGNTAWHSHRSVPKLHFVICGVRCWYMSHNPVKNMYVANGTQRNSDCGEGLLHDKIPGTDRYFFLPFYLVGAILWNYCATRLPASLLPSVLLW